MRQLGNIIKIDRTTSKEKYLPWRTLSTGKYEQTQLVCGTCCDLVTDISNTYISVCHEMFSGFLRAV